MLLHLAALPIDKIISENYDLIKKYNFRVLESYEDIKSKDISNRQVFSGYLLDSGAFTFMKSNPNNINWESYIKSYAEFIKKNKITKYFELDIDNVVGLKRVEKLRNIVEDITGIASIPVWHKSRGLDYWFKMCEDYKYIAIGGIATKEIKRTDYRIFNSLLKISHEKNVKVHGLGFTDSKEIKKYNFYSVDSSNCIAGSRYGKVYKFDGANIFYYSNHNKTKKVNSKMADQNNLIQWLEFSKFMERHF